MGFFYHYKISNYNFYIGEEEGFVTYITLNKIKDYILKETKLIKKTKEELEEYFKGIRTNFDIPLKLKGTDFQKKVWNIMKNIPYGKVISYKHLAELALNPKASRAVGNVCHNNKILIIIPCHRVVSQNSLGGFGCGLEMKKDLLKLEKYLN